MLRRSTTPACCWGSRARSGTVARSPTRVPPCSRAWRSRGKDWASTTRSLPRPCATSALVYAAGGDDGERRAQPARGDRHRRGRARAGSSGPGAVPRRAGRILRAARRLRRRAAAVSTKLRDPGPVPERRPRNRIRELQGGVDGRRLGSDSGADRVSSQARLRRSRRARARVRGRDAPEGTRARAGAELASAAPRERDRRRSPSAQRMAGDARMPNVADRGARLSRPQAQRRRGVRSRRHRSRGPIRTAAERSAHAPDR